MHIDLLLRRYFGIGLVLLLLSASTACGSPTADPQSSATTKTSDSPGQWTQVWRSDFSGPAGSQPSRTDWIYDTGTCYPGCPARSWGTGEVETATNSTGNVRLDGAGHLELIPLLSNGKWTSGRIETKRSDFAAPPGGALEVSASIELPQVSGPAAAGYWPAFWMLGGTMRDGYTGWPAIGELDVMESVDGLPDIFGTMHCGVTVGGPCKEPDGLGSGEQSCSACATGFHTYAVEVDFSTSPEQIRWYRDGQQYFAVSQDQVNSAAWQNAVHHGMFVILDLAIGGGLPDAFAAGPTAATVSGRPMLVGDVSVSVRNG